MSSLNLKVYASHFNTIRSYISLGVFDLDESSSVDTKLGGAVFLLSSKST